MARRKTGRAISGWVIVDKALGLGSTEVVSRVRRRLDARKAGHAGTLDPLASGVLAVALGEATKTIPFVMEADKAYRFTVRWGIATSTDDGEGEVVARSEARPERTEIEAALAAFRGDIAQVPPAFSAVKVDGERAYDLARDGERPELAARPLHVARLDLVAQPDADHATFEMVCGKGGYVRAIARDLGEALGCHGHVSDLRRSATGPFSLEEAVTLEALDAADDPDALLLPVEAGLRDVPMALCGAAALPLLKNGNPAPVLSTEAEFGDTVWAAHGGQALAIGTYRAGLVHPRRVLLT